MKKELLILVFIIALSIFPRIWKLNELPPIVVDEPAYLRDINKMNLNKDFYPANFQWDFSQATLAYYPTILLTKLFFLNELTALRLSSVIFSILALIPFYFLVKKYTNEIVALSSTVLFSFSYYYLQFSRVGWGVIFPIFFGLMLIWIIDGITNSNYLKRVLLSGIVSGVIMYLYRAGEIYIACSFIYLVFKTFRLNADLSKKIFAVILFLTIFLIVSLPWINTIYGNIDRFLLRAKVVSINNVNTPYHRLSNKSEIMIYQITKSLNSWILLLPVDGGGYENKRYLPLSFTPINPILIPLFLMGFILSLIKLKTYFVWILIYGIGIVLGQILTVDPPNGARGLILLPIIYFLIALALFYIYKKFQKKNFVDYALLLLTLAVVIFDLFFYFNWMSWIIV